VAENSINFTELTAGARDVYYRINWEAKLPANHRVFLCVARRDNFVDVTGGYNRRSLFGLAQCFRALNRWTQTVDWWLEGGIAPAAAGNVASNIRQLALPVRPFNGRLTTTDIAADPSQFTYTGTGVGRFFDFEKLDGQSYYFKYGSKLEVDTQMRGMDCTTFPRALFELDSNVAGSVEGNNSAALNIAQDLGAVNEGIEKVNRKVLFEKLFGMTEEREFIRWPNEGLYLLWTTGHIMLYRGIKASYRYGIHEFSGAGNGHRLWKAVGYKETSIMNRSFTSGPYWARKVPRTYEWRVVNTWWSDMFTSDFPPEMDPGRYGIGTPNGPVTSIGGSGSGGGKGAGGKPGGSSYKVVSGDSLSAIAGRFWGDVLLWPILYDANKKVVGSDPNKIYPGQKLTIPDIKKYSQKQLSDARTRGRDWR
jgi:nucleoid-associated protein YgaU